MSKDRRAGLLAMNTIAIREYREDDAPAVGQLIAETYSRYNLDFVSPEDLVLFLGPFQHARSLDEGHQRGIAEVIRSEVVLVAEDGGEIVGVLRGRRERLASLFVRGDRHRQGIGGRLVQRFEQWSVGQGVTVVRLAATRYAVPFYLAMGYKCSTGLRAGWSFDGHGLVYQPMCKMLG